MLHIVLQSVDADLLRYTEQLVLRKTTQFMIVCLSWSASSLSLFSLELLLCCNDGKINTSKQTNPDYPEKHPALPHRAASQN